MGTATHEQITEARALGKDEALAAASFGLDGNLKSDEHYRRNVVAMLDENDPADWDWGYLPRVPNLSGEYADDLTPLSLARGITGEEDPDPDVIDALANAWEEAVSETFAAECERLARIGAQAEGGC